MLIEISLFVMQKKCLITCNLCVVAAEIRKQTLAEKYKELKVHQLDLWLVLVVYIDEFVVINQESGKLEAFMEKRMRRNAAKDRRYMPYRHPTEEQ